MDLSLDLDPKSPGYGDLLLVGGDAVLTSDVDPRGTHPILQSIVQRLKLTRGEWFLNLDLGVPYMQQVLVKRPDRALIESTLRSVILGTPGVLSITQFEVAFSRANRLLSVTFTAQTQMGPVSYKSPLNLPNNQVTQ